MLSNGSSIVAVLSITLLGITVVFSVLLILMLVLNFMKVFSSETKETKETKTTEAITEKSENKVIDYEDDDELIAVLTAAIASSLQTKASNLRIRSYRRLQNKN